jgi:predicted flap endonuclease-1-like 5' DNA nuclease
VLADGAAETEAIHAQHSELYTRLEAFERTHEAKTAEMEAVRTRRAEFSLRLEAFERNLETMDARLDARESENAGFRARLGELEGSLTAKGDELESSEAELAGLRVQVGELEAAVIAKGAAADSAVEQIEALKPEVEQSVALRAEIERLKQVLAEGEARSTPTEGTRVGTLETGQTRPRNEDTETREVIVDFHEPEPEFDEATAPEGPAFRTPADIPLDDRKAARQAVAERFARDPKDQSDDLQTIPGVGALTARILKSMNIHTFRQIASFTPEDIEGVATALNSSPDRFKRNDLIGGARRQHFKKYGEEI